MQEQLGLKVRRGCKGQPELMVPLGHKACKVLLVRKVWLVLQALKDLKEFRALPDHRALKECKDLRV